MEFDFKSWILQQHSEDYRIVVESDDVVKLVNDYGEATIRFTAIDSNTIVEFSIVLNKNASVQFYLHFELNDQEHAIQLFHEMVETFIGLKDKKTLRVLLSCSSGLTTSMFAEELNSMAEMLSLDYHFSAVSYLNIYEEVENYDVVLLAPQIGYMLERLKESLNEHLVLQIPTTIFATYNALEAIQFIQKETENFYQEKKEEEKQKCSCCVQYEKRILSIAISVNKQQTCIYYRLYDKCEVIDSHVIVKNSMNIYDLYDIIDTLLLKHSYIDAVGIATPGIVKDNKMFKEPTNGQVIDMKKDFEDKYGIEVFVYNNANAAAVGFYLEHPEYQNVIFHSQPFGFGVGGQGIVVNGRVVRGKNGVVGEIRYFLRRMQLSNEVQQLSMTQQGCLELVTKALLPSMISIGPEAVALYSPMTPDMNEVKKSLESFVSQEFLPDFFCIKEPSGYMLDGITELCVEHLEKGKQKISVL